jgi:hypothetical protein
MLVIPCGLYHTSPVYPGRSPIIDVLVMLALHRMTISRSTFRIFRSRCLLAKMVMVDWFPKSIQLIGSRCLPWLKNVNLTSLSAMICPILSSSEAINQICPSSQPVIRPLSRPEHALQVPTTTACGCYLHRFTHPSSQ